MEKSVRTTGKYILHILLLASLIVIPAILLFTSLDTIRARDKAWYGGGYDPEYAYLFNSLNMARFRLAGHIDHPGTTMQVTGGLVLQGAWMADHRNETLTKAVLSEPEHYIRILNIATAVIGALALFLLAIFVYRKTHNYWYAVLLQLTPFISGFILFNGFTRITQELMQMIAAFTLAAVSLIWYFQQKGTNQRWFINLFGIIGGFGMASKILFAPLLIIPFILLGPLKDKIRYILVTGLSFLIFTLPVIRLYPNMLYWVYRLFIHSGQYGTGSKEVVDTTRYAGDLVNLFRVSPVLAVIFGISIFFLFVLLIIRLSKKQFPDVTAAKLLSAVVLAQLAGYLLVAKQPKEAYLLPYESIAAINVVIILHLMTSLFQGKVTRNILLAFITLAFIVTIIPYGIARKKAIYTSERNPVWENAWGAATTYPGKEAVICANPGSSPVAGLYFGNAYSLGRYVSDLKELYPDYYLLDAGKEKIFHWGKQPVSIDTLFKRYNGRVVFIGPRPTDATGAGQLKLKTPGWRMQTVYTDEYQVVMAPVAIEENGLSYGRKLIFSEAGASPSDPGKPVSYPEIPYLGLISYDKAYSGHSSILTNSKSPFAFSLDPGILKAGDRFDVSVRASGAAEDLKIVISGEHSQDYYLTSETGKDWKRDEWNLLRLTGIIPEYMSGRKIKLYAWNNGREVAFFDDFRVEIFSNYNSLTPANEHIIGE